MGERSASYQDMSIRVSQAEGQSAPYLGQSTDALLPTSAGSTDDLEEYSALAFVSNTEGSAPTIHVDEKVKKIRSEGNAPDCLAQERVDSVGLAVVLLELRRSDRETRLWKTCVPPAGQATSI